MNKRNVSSKSLIFYIDYNYNYSTHYRVAPGSHPNVVCLGPSTVCTISSLSNIVLNAVLNVTKLAHKLALVNIVLSSNHNTTTTTK